MGVLSVISILGGKCDCEDCEQMHAVSRPRRQPRAYDSVDRLVAAGPGGLPLAFPDSLILFLSGSALVGAGSAVLYATLWACVFLSPGASAADPVAVRQSQEVSAEATDLPTYQAVR